MAVRERIASAAVRCGKDPSVVQLMAVTKTHPRSIVQTAMEAGIRLFGENRVQEAEEKYVGLQGDFDLHLVGHLQRNKARAAMRLFHCVQSIDRLETAQALNTKCAENGKVMDILLEVNTSGEQTKSGFRSREGLFSSLEPILDLPCLRLRGLMTVGPFSNEPEVVRSAFSRLASHFHEMVSHYALPAFDILSMGMSGDFETAVEEGSTLVRIGTALFGPR